MPTVSSASVHREIDSIAGKDSEVISLVAVALNLIKIPHFQRPRIDAHIQKIAREWDRTAYFLPVVALFKGHYVCLDGQQRLAAVEVLGGEEIEVALIEGVISQQRLAALFLRFNRDRRLVQAFDKFVAALDAKDRGSLDVQALLEKFGLEAGRKASSERIPTGALLRVHEKGGAAFLERVLRVVTEAWPTGVDGRPRAAEAHEGQTILGISEFMYRYRGDDDGLSDERVIAVLAANHPRWLITAARQDGTFVANYVAELKNQYNRGLRGKARLK